MSRIGNLRESFKMLRVSSFLFLFVFLGGMVSPLAGAETSQGEKGGQNLQDFIISHVADGNIWHPLPFHIGAVEFPSFEFYGIEFKNGLHATMLLLAAIFLIILFALLYQKNSRRAPKGIGNALEALVLFVRDEICINYMGEKDGRKFAPLFLTFFFFILMLNIMSLIPLFSTATGNINVTAGLAAITFTFMLVGGILRNGPVGFLKIFIPSGVPVPILIVLFPIEIIGFIVKPCALTIRLFANMMAGHLVIFSILGMIITFGAMGTPSLLLALFVYLLEILVSFLQAYIFTMLSAMFLGDVLHPSH